MVRDTIATAATERPAVPLALGLIAGLGVLAALGFLVLFLHLGTVNLYIWDEARLAVNAFEMSRSGELVVTTYNGAPDLWNTKPPLMIWLMAALLRTPLDPVLAVRLPAAVAALATVVLLFVFAARVLHDRLAGLLAGLVLLTSIGFVGPHAGRTGDYDALLALWTTAYGLAWFAYLEAAGRRRWVLLGLFAAALVLAVLTKGVAGLLGLAGLAVYTALRGQAWAVLRDPRILVAAPAIVALCLAWYWLRELRDPGYVAAVLANELGGRFAETNEGHLRKPLYYLKEMLLHRYVPWVYLAPACAFAMLWLGKGRARAAVLLATCFCLAFFVIIEAAGTKLVWYDVPIYPYGALLIGVALAQGFRFAAPLAASRSAYGRELAALTLAGLFVLPVAAALYLQLLAPTAKRQPEPQFLYGDAIDRLHQIVPDLAAYRVLDGGYPNTAGFRNYNAALLFYVELERDRGRNVTILAPEDGVVPGERLLTCDGDALARLGVSYSVIAELNPEGCRFLEVGPAMPSLALPGNS